MTEAQKMMFFQALLVKSYDAKDIDSRVELAVKSDGAGDIDMEVALDDVKLIEPVVDHIVQEERRNAFEIILMILSASMNGVDSVKLERIPT